MLNLDNPVASVPQLKQEKTCYAVLICQWRTVDDILPLHQLSVQLLQVLLLHSQTPRISFQLLCLGLKLSHQLTIHHLRPCMDRRAVRLSLQAPAPRNSVFACLISSEWGVSGPSSVSDSIDSVTWLLLLRESVDWERCRRLLIGISSNIGLNKEETHVGLQEQNFGKT